jgi:hypothetical protein
LDAQILSMQIDEGNVHGAANGRVNGYWLLGGSR